MNALDERGITPLCFTSTCNRLPMLKVLLKLGADTNMPDASGYASVGLAAEEGHVQVIHALAEHGADVNMANKDGETPIKFIAAQSGHANVIRTLAQHGADVNTLGKEGMSPVFVAAANGHTDVIRALAEHEKQISLILMSISLHTMAMQM